jgi:hypothetical protein
VKQVLLRVRVKKEGENPKEKIPSQSRELQDEVEIDTPSARGGLHNGRQPVPPNGPHGFRQVYEA